MVFDQLKTYLWERLQDIHGDIRVVAFLRALSIVGMVGGFGAFLTGMLPPLAAVAIPRLQLAGPSLLKLSVVGLLVYSVSYLYYNATTTDYETNRIRHY
jgi:hypothetical protein